MSPDPRQHSAEHILTAVMGNLFGGKIIDTRFKGNKVRCDFEIKSKLPLEEIIQQAERAANKIISQSINVSFEEVSLAEAQNRCSLHRLPEKMESVQLVCMGKDVITPCCGDHVKNTTEIGSLKIRTFHFTEPEVLRLTFGVE